MSVHGLFALAHNGLRTVLIIARMRFLQRASLSRAAAKMVWTAIVRAALVGFTA